MTSSVDYSPTIFDRLLGTSHTPGFSWGGRGPKPPSDFRYYTCYKGMAEQPNSWTCIQRGMGFFDLVHGSPRLESYDKKEVRVCAYNPSFFDAAVLSAKISAPVSVLVTPK
jgi:hypothetical protein